MKLNTLPVHFLFVVTFFAILLHGYPSRAFFSEYSHYGRQEQSEINAPRLINSEYQSDKLTYLMPIDFTYTWLLEDEIFQFTAGSLGSTRFLTRGRMKMREEIAPGLSFQFNYLELGDYETVRESLVFELSYALTSRWNLAFYIEPSTLKKDDSAGVATEFVLPDESLLRFYYTAVHFSHNKRNEDSDHYMRQPASYGFVWRRVKPDTGSFMELSLRHDQQLKQIFPDSGRIYEYANTSLQLTAREQLSGWKEFVMVQMNITKGFEADNINTDQGIPRWEYDKWDRLLQYQNASWKVDRIGIKAVYQEWRSASGNVIHNDILPHAWVMLKESSRTAWGSHWMAGYEFTWHRGRGPANLRSEEDGNDVVEHRINFRYELSLSQDATFYTLLTFDGDDFGTGRTWEGGSMQFSATF